jgi:hypothetical protein
MKMIKTKKIIIFILFIFVSNANITSLTYWQENNNWQLKIEWNIADKNKTKIENRRLKKALKKELEDKEEYHKTLVENYNNDFSETNLEKLKNNSLIIEKLKKEQSILLNKTSNLIT